MSYSIIISLISALFVSLIYLFLYTQNPGKHFIFWFWSWVMMLIRFLLRLTLLQVDNYPLLEMLIQLFSLSALIFFLYGTFAWMGRKSPWAVIALSAAIIAWTAVARTLELDRMALIVPSYLLSGGVYLYTILAVRRSPDVKGFFSLVLYTALVLIALHKFISPWITMSPEFFPISYLVESGLHMIIAFSLVMAFYRQERLNIQERQEWLDRLLEHSPLPIIILDRQGTVLQVNRRFTELLGYTREEVPDTQALLGRLQPQGNGGTRDSSWLQDLLTPGKETEGSIQKTVTARDGSTFSMEIFAKQVRDNNLLFLNNISDRMFMEQELIKSGKLEVLNLLAGGIGHDFNNILAMILGNTELLKYKARPEWGIEKNLENIARAVQDASQLTRQLVAFTRHGKPVSVPTDIKGIIKETCEFTLSGSECRLQLELAEDLYPVKGDIGNISQMLNHLVLNGVRSMPGGGLLQVRAMNTQIEQHPLLVPGKYVLLELEDQGAGIPEEFIKHVFDPFFNARDTREGLGLATSYSIIRGMNGWIDCQSRLGKGSIFRVYLPASPQARIQEATQSYSYSGGEGQVVLLVEDEKEVRDFILSALQIHGYQVEEFGNAEEAWEHLEQARQERKRYSLVITDLTLSGKLSGLDLYHKIRNLQAELPVILTSGYNDTVTMDSMDDRYFYFLAKPFRIDSLFSVIQRLSGEGEFS